MSSPSRPDQILSAVGALACFAACGWLAWAEWGSGEALPTVWATEDAADEEPTQDDLLDIAAEHAEERRWEAVLHTLEGVSPDGDAGLAAGELRAQAIVERGNERIYRHVLQHVVDDDIDAAARTVKGIPQSSVYRAEADRAIDKSR